MNSAPLLLQLSFGTNLLLLLLMGMLLLPFNPNPPDCRFSQPLPQAYAAMTASIIAGAVIMTLVPLLEIKGILWLIHRKPTQLPGTRKEKSA